MNYSDPLSLFISTLTDTKKSFVTKALVFFGVIGFIFFLNNQLGFSYFYYNEHRLEQIEKIDSILENDVDLSEEERNYLRSLKRETVFKKPVTEEMLGFIGSYNLNFEKEKQEENIIADDVKEVEFRKPINSTWHYLSTNWFLLLIMFILVPIETQKEYKKTGKMAGAIFAFIIMEFLLILLSWALAYIFSFIPRISQEAWPTYLINSTIGVTVLFLPLFIIGLIAKKKA